MLPLRFALTAGSRMIPLAFFDRENSLWTGGTSLSVGWTNADVLAEHLRIGAREVCGRSGQSFRMVKAF